MVSIKSAYISNLRYETLNVRHETADVVGLAPSYPERLISLVYYIIDCGGGQGGILAANSKAAILFSKKLSLTFPAVHDILNRREFEQIVCYNLPIERLGEGLQCEFCFIIRQQATN
jgi:hypothetical protein